MKTDLEIAQGARAKDISEIARGMGIADAHVVPFGRNKAKISLDAMADGRKTEGRLILVTALSPTPAGEGKTTVSIGLADGLRRLKKNAGLALREPSLGPVFGIKGGAAGGGWSQVIPMEEINLHFTGDLHAVTSANNLLCALLDNHIQHGDKLGIDVKNVAVRRCMDMNDRQLRNIVCGLGRSVDGVPREDGFDITAACEVMAVLCMATSISDLRHRLSHITAAYTKGGEPVLAGDLKAGGPMAVLLKDALLPNLVQTLDGTPTFMHGGPFANIAHGCNSVVATKMAIHHCDYTVTEAGFGADLGAEKFLDIKCRNAGIWPDAAVVVATVRALKYHGGAKKENLKQPDMAALATGFANLDRHIANLKNVYGLSVVVAVNKFDSDTSEEIQLLQAHLAEGGTPCAVSTAWADGGAGAEALAQAVLDAIPAHSLPAHPYDYALPLRDKVRAVAQKIYGADSVEFDTTAKKKLRLYEEQGYANLPVCIAKTQYSFSDDPKKLGAPQGFELSVRDAKLNSGAGFVVVLCGDIMRMPGLPQQPAAMNITIDDQGNIEGLF